MYDYSILGVLTKSHEYAIENVYLRTTLKLIKHFISVSRLSSTLYQNE